MPQDRLSRILESELARLDGEGRRKGAETVIRAVLPPAGGRGPRYLVEGEGNKPFLRMNANNYLGMSLRAEVVAAEEAEVAASGAGPGAVRFIGGTWSAHVALERRLAAFHRRDSAMIFSSAYAAVMGTLPGLITPDTAVISDELNHNSIINAIRLARPREKRIYPHLDMRALDTELRAVARTCTRAIVVTDGVFSMRGDHAPLAEVLALSRKHDAAFPENVVVVVDDSHGVGAFGDSGRGTEEHTGSGPADLLIGTLGKALGVNGGYVCGGASMIAYLRESSPFYVYSNPITPGEAAAAAKAVDILDSDRGLDLLRHLRVMTRRFADGVVSLGFAVIAGQHPIVPLLVRDTGRTVALVRHLRHHGVLATGLGFPVVPRGDEEIRFQICADHTQADIDQALGVLKLFQQFPADGD